jgi:hypothetical protein
MLEVAGAAKVVQQHIQVEEEEAMRYAHSEVEEVVLYTLPPLEHIG